MRDAVRVVLDGLEDIELVGEAANGHELLPLVARVEPDFVLLDVQLPGLDGLACLEALAARHPRVRVAMLSAVDDHQVIESAFRRGARGYIRKTVNPFDLPAAIRQIVDETVIHRPLSAPPATGPRSCRRCPRRKRPCSQSSRRATRTRRSRAVSG